MTRTLRCLLRPYLHQETPPKNREAYARFFRAATKASRPASPHDTASESKVLWSSNSYKQRLEQLRSLHPAEHDGGRRTSQLYPRLGRGKRTSLVQFKKEAAEMGLQPDTHERSRRFWITGKITSKRVLPRMTFLSITEDEVSTQVMLDLTNRNVFGGVLEHDRAWLKRSLSIGDHYAFKGHLYSTQTGGLALSVDEKPQLLTPALHEVPKTVTDTDTLARLPQLDLLMHQRRRDLLRLRHVVERTISDFLDTRNFTRVSTPILAADTGGAIAQPFVTTTKELPDIPLRLRISPELSLKKLVAAGLGSVYEIGPSFRNEGLDATHNPEFTTCEFYEAYATLDKLISMTEQMFADISLATSTAIKARLTSLLSDTEPALSTRFFSHVSENGNAEPAQRLQFLKTLVEQIRKIEPVFSLPAELDDSAAEDLIPLFERLDIRLPQQPTTARLLDALGARFIEPLCKSPTWIVEHPAIMSPLAKGLVHSKTGHLVSARAELFVNGVELVNLYEEENDPFAQARKFLQQSHGSAALKDELGVHLDHEEVKRRLTPGQQYYVRVLEMGLPPTGGWGCGLDRLVMLFGGAKRISEVLPFGGLRNVIAMGTAVGKDGKLIVDRSNSSDEGRVN